MLNRALDGAVDLDHIDRQSDPAPWIAEALADGLDLDGLKWDERRLASALVAEVLKTRTPSSATVTTFTSAHARTIFKQVTYLDTVHRRPLIVDDNRVDVAA